MRNPFSFTFAFYDDNSHIRARNLILLSLNRKRGLFRTSLLSINKSKVINFAYFQTKSTSHVHEQRNVFEESKSHILEFFDVPGNRRESSRAFSCLILYRSNDHRYRVEHMTAELASSVQVDLILILLFLYEYTIQSHVSFHF